MTVANYVTQLFPNFDQNDVSRAAAVYTNDTSLVTTNDKAIGIMGECKSFETMLLAIISMLLLQRSSFAQLIYSCSRSKEPPLRYESLAKYLSNP